MKQITMDWETYQNELKQSESIGYRSAMVDVRKILNRKEIDDCFDLFDVYAYEDHELNSMIKFINKFKEASKSGLLPIESIFRSKD